MIHHLNMQFSASKSQRLLLSSRSSSVYSHVLTQSSINWSTYPKSRKKHHWAFPNEINDLTFLGMHLRSHQGIRKGQFLHGLGGFHQPMGWDKHMVHNRWHSNDSGPRKTWKNYPHWHVLYLLQCTYCFQGFSSKTTTMKGSIAHQVHQAMYQSSSQVPLIWISYL